MNTSALKAFAPAVRRQLMEAVTRKLDFVLSARTPDYLTTFAPQVAALRALAVKDRNGLIERIAYTWFNRFTALRYLDAKGWHPFRARVLTPFSPEEIQPELLKLTRNGNLPEELRRHTDGDRLNDLLDGRIPTAIPNADPQGEVYRHLVLAACRFYYALMPDLFEKLDDETELLLPDDLLTEQSVVQGFRTEITDEDCAEVELIGWLYQFYIAEKKDAVMARKSVVPTEDIPAVTQLFTPHWIVRYLVENSLGRLWLLNRPGSKLREQMSYYIEGEPETEFLKITKPEEIRVLDPAVGSGHMLTYAFDLLYAIYEEEGYPPSDIAGLILSHNLYGLDIDPRAAQLASMALVLKAREKSRRFFQIHQMVQPHIIALQDVSFEEGELREYIKALKLGDLFDQPVLQLMRQFEHVTTFGSLIQPNLDEAVIDFCRDGMANKDLGGQLFLRDAHVKILRVLEQAEVLTQQYHVVAANPPYMGTAAMNQKLKDFIECNWAAGKADTYSAFMLRNLKFAFYGGRIAMITTPNWMFLKGFEILREVLLQKTYISSLVHCGRGVWGPDFGSCAFVFQTSKNMQRQGVFKRLFKRPGEIQSNEEIEANFFNVAEYPSYFAASSDFHGITGLPIAYWISKAFISVFQESEPLIRRFQTRLGLSTANNERFLRFWFEVVQSTIKMDAASRDTALKSRKRWFPYQKGGAFRKWFGNGEFLVDWRDDGSEIKNFGADQGRIRSHNYNLDYIFREGVTWSDVTSGRNAFRYMPSGHLFDGRGSSGFTIGDTNWRVVLGLLNSSVSYETISLINPTIAINVGEIGRIPYHKSITGIAHTIAKIVDECVSIARADWNNFETSWEFRDQPLLRSGLKGATLEASWRNWKAQSIAAIRRMQELETENNRLFIDAYGLQDELSPEVPENQITLARADARKDVAAFLSYAVGCMMGRYSLDQPVLILADSGDRLTNYLAKVGKSLDQLTFVPDEDGIIPILEGAWFEDDIIARTREFLRATFGENTLRENVRFIEESLGKDLRKYFLTDFYKNHISNERSYGYKKRPIYWLVQSPQKGFSALIYLHRYTRDTLNLVLNRYLRPYQDKLRSRIAHLAQVQASEGMNARDKTAARKEADKLTKILHECEEWERQTLLPLAQARIELDLDDGVKVNYQKLGEALAPIPGLAATED